MKIRDAREGHPEVTNGDSQTGYIRVVPLGSKYQFHHVVQERVDEYSATTNRSDNEPTTRQTLKTLVNARHSLGHTTRLITSKLGDHSFLSQNTVDRVRKLAGSFIEGVQSRLGTKSGSDLALWTWAARHARQSLVQLPISLSMARVTKDFLLNMVNQFMVTARVLVKERQDGFFLVLGRS